MISNRYRRIICLILALLMICAMLPVYSFAEDTGTGEETSPVTEPSTEPTEEVPPPTETEPEPTQSSPPVETVPEPTETAPPPPAETEPEPTEEVIPPAETVPEVTEPVPETTEEILKYKLAKMYKQVLDLTGKESLGGLCATLVTWELYISRINRKFVSGDGKDQFDNYRDLDMTTGGYHVLALSAEDYTLEEALLTITCNGTRDAGPVLIGFEKTRSAEGSRYGHTVFIGGIIDGNVYYVESNDYTVAGVVYPEGTPIVCTIEQFANEYAGWATFEGAVEFSQTLYRDVCEIFPTNIYIRADAATDLWTEPCLAEVSPWTDLVRPVRAQEVFHVNGIVRNTEGNYWYRTAGENPLYLSAENTSMVYNDFSGAEACEIVVPAAVEAGGDFKLSGSVLAGDSTLRMVRAQIFSGRAGEGTLVKDAALLTNTHEFELEELGEELQIGDLEPGIYHCVISAIARNSFVGDGEIKYRPKLLDLWTAEFQVYDGEDEEPAALLLPLILDSRGGSCTVQQILVEADAQDAPAVVPQRTGYRFDEWQQTAVEEEQEGVPASMYACWSMDTAALEGWCVVDGLWRFYEEGTVVTGMVTLDGITYFVNPDGTLHTGWLEADKKTYYFFENGAAACGVQTIDDEQYFFGQSGAMVAFRFLK